MTSHFFALESCGILETFTNYATFTIPVDFLLFPVVLGVHVHR